MPDAREREELFVREPCCLVEGPDSCPGEGKPEAGPELVENGPEVVCDGPTAPSAGEVVSARAERISHSAAVGMRSSRRRLLRCSSMTPRSASRTSAQQSSW